ncbi:FAD-dependent oxidoreductase [Halioxenophilus aromaticivorans]|uniref:FAD-dependent oxidoreductase n=2 Tax=Halioxenophilus aromaticivorans TaxID=1306992 RepID=A0AAV3U5W1_9ALTE
MLKVLEKDVVVVGSGGAGMTAALVAAISGLDVLLIEKTDFFGGTTAWSGGGIWVPCSTQAMEAGVDDSTEQARDYIHNVVGSSVRADLVDAFLENAPAMVDFLSQHSQVQFTLQQGFPDWHPDSQGYKDNGRLLSPVEFDGKELGDWFATLRAPLSEFNAPGGFMIGLDDVEHIANAKKSLASFLYLGKLLIRFGVDKIRRGRSTRLTMGNALAARLLLSCVQQGVELWNRSHMTDLITDTCTSADAAAQERVTGIVIKNQEREIQVNVRRGVISACGGFSANVEMRERYIPFPEHHVSLVPEGNTGDGIQAGLQLGATFDGENISNAGWVVVSLHVALDGSVIKFPHLFLDRGKPGCIAVNQRAERFGNESATNLVEPMHRTGSVPAYLLCDHRFIKKYGLGLVRPGGIGLNKMLREGYLTSGETLAELAKKLELPEAQLQTTVGRFNEFAKVGRDEDFNRGQGPGDTALGDKNHSPNPCLGRIEVGPFYAVKVYPGDTTTTVGLRVNEQAQVLDEQGNPIAGLQAIGLDMNSLWRGKAPGNGGNNTLGMTFGYVAANALINRNAAPD